MWCAKCQADVAAIASANNQRASCATCNSELLVAPAPSNSAPVVRDPRELLARWAQEDALDPLQHRTPAAANVPVTALPPTAPRRDKPASRPPQRRIDKQPAANAVTAQSVATVVEATHPAPSVVVPPVVGAVPQGNGKPEVIQDVTIHRQHLAAGNPHFEAAALLARQKRPDRSGRWVTFAGQLAAYCGVATLTVGASFVLVAYFGGPQNYAPIGWLITTAGQMLLFLGVVTLVSGGMEQTSQEVADRIDSLGAQILSLEDYRARKAASDQKTDAA